MNENSPERPKVRHVPHVSLRAVREARGLSQAEMGKRIGKEAGRAPLHFSTVGKIERGEREITARLLRPLAKAYRISADDIVWVDDDSPASEGDPDDEEADDTAGKAA